MNYNISSDKFDNFILKELLEKLNRYFEEKKLPFYVIGATARDIIMQNITVSYEKVHKAISKMSSILCRKL